MKTLVRIAFCFFVHGSLATWNIAQEKVVSEITILVPERGEEETIVLKVCNAGRPISEDALPSIFEPLIQAPSGGTSRPEERSKTSLGLGLFIVREIVAGHDGTISVTSAADIGTVFTIRLPRARIDSQAPRVQTAL